MAQSRFNVFCWSFEWQPENKNMSNIRSLKHETCRWIYSSAQRRGAKVDWSNTSNAVDQDCEAIIRAVGIGTGLKVGTILAGVGQVRGGRVWSKRVWSQKYIISTIREDSMIRSSNKMHIESPLTQTEISDQTESARSWTLIGVRCAFFCCCWCWRCSNSFQIHITREIRCTCVFPTPSMVQGLG